MTRERAVGLQVGCSYLAAIASFAAARNVSNTSYYGLPPGLMLGLSALALVVWIVLAVSCFRYDRGVGVATLPGGLLALTYPFVFLLMFTACYAFGECI